MKWRSLKKSAWMKSLVRIPYSRKELAEESTCKELRKYHKTPMTLKC